MGFNSSNLWKAIAVVAGLIFLFASVLAKLAGDWWADENYSHGLIIPFVIGYIVWAEFDNLRFAAGRSEIFLGMSIAFVSLIILLAGTLGAELFTQRISLVLMIAGILVYFFGRRILRELVVPFVLLLLAIPIPQIIFNKIAFPLQMMASKAADWGIGLFNISTTRRGNIIQIVPIGQSTPVGLEVVEACSGIRSLMTLVSLALILGYFTRERRERIADNWSNIVKTWDFWRIIILMASAVPIALFTNGARVMVTGILTYYYGAGVAKGFWHDMAGWAVFISALIIMIAFNGILKRFGTAERGEDTLSEPHVRESVFKSNITSAQTVFLFIALLCGGVLINWLHNRSEPPVERVSLKEMPRWVGNWEGKGVDPRFSADTERVLGASDYVMRYYFAEGTYINFYAGYYSSQRTGNTYHSPLNCLPGSGWEMKDPGVVEIERSNGGSFLANRYIVQNGNNRQIMVYWYQGRGRATANEYLDKIYTSWDSLMTRRSDGAMVRVMTPIGEDEEKALRYAVEFSSGVADVIGAYVPD